MLLFFAALLTLGFVLLTVPIMVAFRVDRSKEFKGQVYVNWFFGLVRFRINMPADLKTECQRRRISKAKKPKRTKGRARTAFRILLKEPLFRRRLFRFVKDLLGAVHARDLYLRLRIGLGDPADTGILWGFLGPVAGLAENLRSAEVLIEPEFVDSVFEVESHGRFRFIPLQFIALAAAFTVSPSTLQAWRTLRRSQT